jgi:hypothetical protein
VHFSFPTVSRLAININFRNIARFWTNKKGPVRYLECLCDMMSASTPHAAVMKPLLRELIEFYSSQLTNPPRFPWAARPANISLGHSTPQFSSNCPRRRRFINPVQRKETRGTLYGAHEAKALIFYQGSAKRTEKETIISERRCVGWAMWDGIITILFNIGIYHSICNVTNVL